MPLLDIENLTVEFKTASGWFRAVDSVSLVVDSREVLAIVGESGSGKSVSMLAVMGLLPWTARVTADRLRFVEMRACAARHEEPSVLPRALSCDAIRIRVCEESPGSIRIWFRITFSCVNVLPTISTRRTDAGLPSAISHAARTDGAPPPVAGTRSTTGFTCAYR